MEAEKREEKSRETKETEQHEDYIHTVLFAAGTALLVACAVMVYFIEQWRAWVFLVLNLVLLAILFTSMRPTSSEEEESNCTVEFPIESKKRRQGRRLVAVEERRECCKLYKSRSEVNKEEEVEDGVELVRLSKEELNERVEAFIAMFRQHLVSDAKKW